LFNLKEFLMKTLSLMAAVLALGLTLATVDAEAAKRLGGGSSYGMQKKMNSPAKESAATPAKSPTAAPATAPSATTTPPVQPKPSWMGPIAGLAAGLGLAALASHLGFGEGLATALMIGLLVMAAIAVVGLIMRRRASLQQPAMAGAGHMSYTPAEAMPGDVDVAPTASARSLPHDFDVNSFEHQAKINFIRLQAANDAGNLDDLREFTTPEMFEKLKDDIAGRHGEHQHTDVLEVRAKVLEVDEEASRYVVSVLYSGMIREDKDMAAESIDEVWHLEKPRHGSSGWLLTGIQQLQ
jgi:predicted lipid-binding transport protein (Tim44 family)